MSDFSAYGIIILAAGNSSRLGEPKQLLKFNGKSLLRHVAEESVAAATAPVVVVTGSNHKTIGDEVAEFPVMLAHNPSWQQGMASSISVGLNALLKISPKLHGVIITVSDQPFITSALFQKLIITGENTKCIVASAYDNTLGTPVLFQNQHFEHLLNLKGSEGAKKLLKKFEDDVTEVLFELGRIDIDTKEDYDNLLTNKL